MDFDRIAFDYYNPFTDTKLCPSTADEVFSESTIPSAFYDTVRRMKRLVEGSSIEFIRNELLSIEKWVYQGQMMIIDNPNPIYKDADYQPAGSADSLFTYFEYVDHQVDLEQQALAFGILAGAITGTIYNALWPGESILAGREANREKLKSLGLNEEWVATISYPDLMFEAVKAVLYGEQAALRADYGRDKAISEKNRKNASLSKKNKEPIFEKYIEWALSLGDNHQFTTETEAMFFFIQNKLDDSLKRLLTSTTQRTMAKKLKEHCEKLGIERPFAKR